MISKNITVKKSTRYYMSDEPGPNIRQIWLVCHGYGQLAESFLKEFDILTNIPNHNRLIVAPEALHHFYLSGGHGRIGASWMTSADRLNNIDDYINYLNTVNQEISQQCPNASETIILGFSQGASTACRWALMGNTPVQHLIIWAGEFPPDIQCEIYAQRLKDLKITMVFGTKDPYARQDHVQQQKEMLDDKRINYSIKTFVGYHEINADMLLQLP